MADTTTGGNPNPKGRNLSSRVADIEQRVESLEEYRVEIDEKTDGLRLREAQKALSQTVANISEGWVYFWMGLLLLAAPVVFRLLLFTGPLEWYMWLVAAIFWAWGTATGLAGLREIIVFGRLKDRLLVKVSELQQEYDQLPQPESGSTHEPGLVNVI